MEKRFKDTDFSFFGRLSQHEKQTLLFGDSIAESVALTTWLINAISAF